MPERSLNSQQQRLREFFADLASATHSRLLLDFDGTLAPFRPQRMEARPYDGVIERLARIQQAPTSGITMISGRPASEVATLLQPLSGIEIHGAHGLELRTASGDLQRTPLAEADAAALRTARNQLEDFGMSVALEEKAGGLALHWRDQSTHAAEQMRALALRLWTPLLAGTSLRLLPFDGGLELRVTRPHKGDAVLAILHDLPGDTRVAYLGDDATDEDAFRSIGPNGCAVLVRPEHRPTAASIWLRPPQELLMFLDEWIAATGNR
jgi:trehalose-phosphatase